jgi:lipopolysaccharide biosynthesis regulator YciM
VGGASLGRINAAARVETEQVNDSDENVLRFIAASFPSVWALEVLLALRRERRPWAREELVATLRASELVVAKALDALIAAGLASVDCDWALYLPANRDVDECMDRVEQLYRARPNAVRRAIIATSTGSAAAFANAFKLRKKSDD